MAAVTAPARVGAQHQSLLHFVGEAPWSDENVLAKVREVPSRFVLEFDVAQSPAT
jgi:SRSO17 transposase